MTTADTIEVYRRGGLWWWQRYTETGTSELNNSPIGRSQGPFATELVARRDARRLNPDATVMLPASSSYQP